MNNIKLDVTIPSLSLLTPTGVDTYALVAKFFKSDGTPLDNANIANSNPLTVTTTTTSFSVNIPIVNGTWSIDDPIVRLYANDDTNCCFAARVGDIINTITEISVEAVLMNQFGSGRIFKYEPDTDTTIELFTTGQALSPDVAHTSNRVFVYGISGSDLILQEYSLVLSPFSVSFIRNYTMSEDIYGAGLCAVSNTELYIAGDKLYRITISGTTATPTEVFTMPTGYECTGDLIYDPATELILMSYDNLTDYRIGVFDATDGTLVRSALAPVNNIFGMYQFEGNTYVVAGGGQIYSLNLTTLATTPTTTTSGSPIAGASQIQSNISIPA